MRSIRFITVISILGASLFGLVSWKSNSKVMTVGMRHTIQDTELLRMEILKSVELPFSCSDTIVLNCAWAWSICGLSTENELSHIFKTCLDQKPYIQLLSKRLGVPIVSVEAYWVNVCKSSEIKKGIDPFERNKVRATIRAEIIKLNSVVIVDEYYEHDKKVYHLRKEFYFDIDQKWHFRVI